jgi:integrase
MARRPRVPTYRRHSSGQARVTVNGKDHLLGPYNSPESKEAYRRLVAEWLALHDRPAKEEGTPLAVNDLILGYWNFAKDYYGFDGRRGDEACLRDALRVLRSLYGHTPAADFGPLALKTCRAEMIKKDRSRTYVNAQVDRVRRAFRWAASEQLVPASVYAALKTVEGFRRGRTEARETKKVKPVASEQVEVTLPHMPAVVRAMVSVQQLTGCRPDEARCLCPLDLDMSSPGCWVYRPGSDQGPHGKHKTAHEEKDRLVLIGPRAQEVLWPYLGTKLDAYCFSPSESERRRSADRRQIRKTPLTPSQRARAPKTGRKRALGTFTESATSLSPDTGYSYVAFATNSAGTTYTSPVSTFTTLPTVQFSAAAETVPESAASFSVNVTLSGPFGQDVSVPFTLGGSAVSGTDFSGVTASPLTIKAGQTSATITGTLLADPGASPALTITLGNPTNASLGGTTVNTLTIVEPPALALPGAQTAYENVAQAITGITVGASQGDSLTVKLSVGDGTLTLGKTSGLTVAGSGGFVTLAGSAADLNAALATLTYLPTHDYSGADALSVTVSDGSQSTGGSVAISVKSIAQQAADL